MTTSNHHYEIRRALEQRNLIPFVGAGLSIGAGLPGWYTLVAGLAHETGVSLPPGQWASGDALIDAAQSYVNQRGMNSLILRLKDRLDTTATGPTEAHRALARLPVSLVFTANYDDLLERAFRDAGRRVHIVAEDGDLPLMLGAGEGINIVKLYGDLSRPHTIVLARQQYETFFLQRPQMIKLLETELARSHMLYLGWSQTDPHFNHLFGETFNRFGGLIRRGFSVMFEVEESRRTELQRKQIDVIELPAGTSRTAALAAWLGELVPEHPPGLAPDTARQPAADTNGQQRPSHPVEASDATLLPVSDLRKRLHALDDLQLEAFCQDHFPQVAVQFGSGQSRDAKVNRLIDHCLRKPGERERLTQLLGAEQE